MMSLELHVVDDVLHMVLPGPTIGRDALQGIEDQMLHAVKSTPSPLVVVDFAKVEFLPTIGLGTLIAVQKWTRERDGRLRIAALTGRVSDLFRISRLDRIFEIDATVEEAIANLRAG